MKRPTREALYDLLYVRSLTQRQAAARLGVSYETIRRWVMEYNLGARQVATTLARKLEGALV